MKATLNQRSTFDLPPTARRQIAPESERKPARIQRHVHQLKLWVLCLDDVTYPVMKHLSLPDLEPISISELERADSSLLVAKENRGFGDFALTCKPVFAGYIFDRDHEAEIVTYLDADLYFFSAPSAIYRQMKRGSVGLVKHDFPAKHPE